MQLSYRERSIDISYEKTPPIVPRAAAPRDRRPDRRRRARSVEPLDAGGGRGRRRAACSRDGVESIAVALYNAYANPRTSSAWRRSPGRRARPADDSVSTEVDRRIGEYERTSTAVLNAIRRAAHGALRRRPRRTTCHTPIRYMHSGAGALPAAEARRAADPARPLRPRRRSARRTRGRARTSASRTRSRWTWAARAATSALIWDDELRFRTRSRSSWGVPARVRRTRRPHDRRRRRQHLLARRRRRAPGRPAQRRRRARARPATAAAASEPTVTDANLVLGVITPAGLLGGELPLDLRRGARGAVAALAGDFERLSRGARARRSTRSSARTWHRRSARSRCARGSTRARACSSPSAARPAACGRRSPPKLEHPRRRRPRPTASVLSTLGLLTAPSSDHLGAHGARAPRRVARGPARGDVLEELARDACARLGSRRTANSSRADSLGLRYVGQSHEVAIGLDPEAEPVAERFACEHERLYGTRLADPVEIVDSGSTVSRPRVLEPDVAPAGPRCRLEAPASATSRLVDAVVPVYERDALAGRLERALPRRGDELGDVRTGGRDRRRPRRAPRGGADVIDARVDAFGRGDPPLVPRSARCARWSRRPVGRRTRPASPTARTSRAASSTRRVG